MRPGDTVPLPAAVWLFVSGLVGLMGVAGRKDPGSLRTHQLLLIPGLALHYDSENHFQTELYVLKSESSLTELANHFGSDKGTTGLPGRHGYTIFYEPLFTPIRDKSISMLEVGLCVGGPEVGGSKDRVVTKAPSLAMWFNYFPRAKIYGFDISDFSAFSHPRITFIRGDAGSKEDLQQIANTIRAFDFIIDDGSHASYHQQLTFVTLFSLVKPDGLFIIEDLHWQPENYERNLPRVPLTSSLFRMLQSGTQVPNDYCLKEELEAQLPSIASIQLFSANRNQDLTWSYSKDGREDKLLIIRKHA